MKHSSVQPRYAVASTRFTQQEKEVLLNKAKKARKSVSDLLYEAAADAGLLKEEK